MVDPTVQKELPDKQVSVDQPARSPPPTVTVGLAVYNGERYLAEAIDSILAQTYEDFELVISDNCSTDSTPEICARYAQRDRRVRYFSNPSNIGGIRNENRTFFLARGRYFKLAAHDDRVAPQFLERCVELLDGMPEVEVCATGVVMLGARGETIETKIPRAGTERRPHSRFRSLSGWDYGCEAIYGVIRVAALEEVRPQSTHSHSDRVVLSELSLRAPFHVIEEPLFFKRLHESNVGVDWRARMIAYQPELAWSGAIRIPHWHQLLDYATMILRSPLRAPDKFRCAREWLRCAWRMRRELVLDLRHAAKLALATRERRRLWYARKSS